MDTNEINDLFNSYMGYGGFKVDYGNTPSPYITKVKLKRALKELSDMDIEEILEKELTPFGAKKERVRLIKKVERLQVWQLLHALNILLNEGRIEVITYVSKCKHTDKPVQ